jgi:hypothetical protein
MEQLAWALRVPPPVEGQLSVVAWGWAAAGATSKAKGGPAVAVRAPLPQRSKELESREVAKVTPTPGALATPEAAPCAEVGHDTEEADAWMAWLTTVMGTAAPRARSAEAKVYTTADVHFPTKVRGRDTEMSRTT